MSSYIFKWCVHISLHAFFSIFAIYPPWKRSPGIFARSTDCIPDDRRLRLFAQTNEPIEVVENSSLLKTLLTENNKQVIQKEPSRENQLALAYAADVTGSHPNTPADAVLTAFQGENQDDEDKKLGKPTKT